MGLRLAMSQHNLVQSEPATALARTPCVHFWRSMLRVLLALVLAALVACSDPIKDTWRVRVTQLSSNGWEAYFRELRFFDITGNEIVGAFESSRSNTGINTINDGDTATQYRFPPGEMPAVGDFIKFVCIGGCEIAKMDLLQSGSAGNRIWGLAIDSSTNSGSDWTMEAGPFNTNFENVVVQWKTWQPTMKPTMAPTTPPPTRTPTATPIFAPTRMPTRLPSVAATQPPTPSPSFVMVPCTTSCSFASTQVALAAGNPIARITLATNFKVTFSVQLSSLALNPQLRNILDLRDAQDGTVLYRVSITDARNLQTEYAGVVYHPYGPMVVTSYSTTFTTVTITHSSSTITTYSNGDTYTDSHDITTAPIDTTGRQYYLYLSGPANPNVPSATGYVKDVYIESLTGKPTAGPTLTPSSAPTFPLADCRFGCSFGGPYGITGGQIIGRIKIPNSFQIKMLVTIDAFDSAGNILQIRNTPASNAGMIAISYDPTRKIQVNYNNAGAIYGGSYLGTAGSEVLVTVIYCEGRMAIRSSNGASDSPFFDAPGALVDNTDIAYDVYLSAFAGYTFSAGQGVVRNIQISEYIPPPTTTPTGSPTIAPTANPTRAPTRKPTPSPSTFKPTFLPTAQPSLSPTFEVADCRVSCTLSGSYTIIGGQMIGQIKVANNFQIIMQVTVDTYTAGGNILQIRSPRVTSGGLIAVGYDVNRKVLVNYNGLGVPYDGSYLGSATYEVTVTVIYYQGQIAVRTSHGTQSGAFFNITAAPVDNADVVCDVYLSAAPSQTINAGQGTVRDIQISEYVPSPSARPSAAPTLAPTLAPVNTKPTMKPTTKPTTPTAVPTARPTSARPSYVATDCRSYCQLVGSTPQEIVASYHFADILLSDNFEVSFDVILNSLASSTGDRFENIIELSDRATLAPLFRVHITDTVNLRMSYDNYGYISSGPYVNAAYSTEYTTVKFMYAFGSVYLWTSAYPNADIRTVENVVNTADKVFSVWLSARATHIVTPFGYVKNLVVRAITPQPSTAPTVIATVPPTTRPTPLPTVRPTAVPTARPSTSRPSYLTTDCRTHCLLIGPTPQEIVSDNSVADISIADSFDVSFDVLLNALGPDSETNPFENIIGIAEQASLWPLLRVHILNTGDLRVTYDNEVYITSGAAVNSAYSTIYTSVRVTLLDGVLTVWTSASPTPVRQAVTSVISTSNVLYSVFVSSKGSHVVTPFGYVKNLVVRAAATTTLAPTATPTVAPTVVTADCHINCRLITGQRVAIAQSKAIADVTLADNFEFTFDVTVQARAIQGNVYGNIIDVVRPGEGVRLFRISISDAGLLKVVYQSTSVVGAGPRLDFNGSSATDTLSVTFSVGDEQALLWTSRDPSVRYGGEVAQTSTAGLVYRIYASGPNLFPLADGAYVSNIAIRGVPLDPTQSPTAQSTVPTVAPTARLLDCRVMCTQLADPIDISVGHIAAQLLLPTHFFMQFKVKVPDVPSAINFNILEIRDDTAGKMFVRLSVNSEGVLRISYNNVIYSSIGPPLGPDRVTEFTTVAFFVYDGVIQVYTYYDLNRVDTYPLLAQVDTTGHTFTLYTSAPTETFTATGGVLKDFTVAEFRPPTKSPTALPTAPTAPTTAPTARLMDCRVKCADLIDTGATLNITAGYMAAKLVMPTSFKLKFRVKVPAMPPTGYVDNILDIRDDTQGATAIRVSLKFSSELCLAYYGALLTNNGPKLRLNYATEFTQVAIVVHNGVMQVATDRDSSRIDTYPLTQVDATGRQFTLFTSSNVVGYNSTGGVMTDFSIGEYWVPSAAPTVAPTAPPTVRLLDCTGFCNQMSIDGTVINIATGTVAAKVLLLPSFALQFSVKIPALPSPAVSYSILELYDEVNDVSLLRAFVNSQGIVRFKYNGVGTPQLLPKLRKDYATEFTAIVFKIQGSVLTAYSDANFTDIGHATLASAPVDTTGNVYTLYTSSPTATDGSAGGVLMGFSAAGYGVPTAKPTVVPTYRLLDCTVTCDDLVADDPQPLAAGSVLAQALLPSDLHLQFDVMVSALPLAGSTAPFSLLEIRDDAHGVSLLRIGVGTSRRLHIYYGGNLYTTAGPLIRVDYSASYTRIFFRVCAGVIEVYTSRDMNLRYTAPVHGSQVDTIGNTYTVYASSPDASEQGASGSIKAFAAAKAFTVAPTVSPSAPPTALPTVPYLSCVGGCMFLGGAQPVSIQAGNAAYEITLPNNFEMEFSLTISESVVGGPYNIIQLIRKGAGVELFRVSIAEGNRLVLTVNDVDYLGPTFPTSVARTVLVNVGYGKVGIGTPTVDGAYVSYDATGLRNNLASDRYVMYASGPDLEETYGQVRAFYVRQFTRTMAPTTEPTRGPHADPTVTPIALPSSVTPTIAPSQLPSPAPTTTPTTETTLAPTVTPTAMPSTRPSAMPSENPTADPTWSPTPAPSGLPSPSPSAISSAEPTLSPSVSPSTVPSEVPSVAPSMARTGIPTVDPSVDLSAVPSTIPSTWPTREPSAVPSTVPSARPSEVPSSPPNVDPTRLPTGASSEVPSEAPSEAPFRLPSAAPSRVPSIAPTAGPTTVAPSVAPTVRPTVAATTSTTPRVSSVSAPPTAAPTLAPAPKVLSVSAQLDATSPKSAVVVEVGLEGDAILYCGAFDSSVVLTSPNDIISQRFSATSVNRAARVTVTGLAAATTYRVYCATQSFAGAVLSVDGTLAHSATVTTQCCKVATLKMASIGIPTKGAVLDGLQIGLDALPDSDLTVTLSATGATSSDAVPVFRPNAVTFRKGAAQHTAAVTVAAGAAGEGDYTVSALLSGTDAAKYASAFSRSSRVTVHSASSTPAVPRLDSTAFDSEGTAVLLTFSASTNQAGYFGSFVCGQLLDFVGKAAARCQWSDASTIAIYPSRGAGGAQQMLAVGDFVTLLGANNVTAACADAAPSVCAGYAKVSSTVLTVAAPAVKARPTAVLSLPSALSGCSPMTVDISASSGSGGRSWQRPVFSVTSTAGDMAAVQWFLNHNFTLDAPTEVPSALFTESSTYTFTMTLCNFLGACDTASRSVSVDKNADAALMVAIAGRPLREVTATSALVLSSSYFLLNCQGSRLYSGLVATWAVYEGGVLQPQVRSESPDGATFRLSPYRLVPLHYYEVRLTVSHPLTGASSSASVTVKVVQAEVVAMVKGGSARNVPIGGTITLDGSESVDKDKQGVSGAAAGLLFAWTCVQTAPFYDLACPLALSADGSVTAMPETAALVLHALPRAINTTAVVTLTVTDAAKTRSSTTSVTVRSLDSAAPLMAVTTRADALTYVNAGRPLRLSGTITVQSSCTARWRSPAFPAGLGSRSLTAPSTVIPTGTSQTVTLLLAAGVLPERSSLTFQLSCGASAASVVVTTNGPPLPGTFAVSPPNGTELTTAFQFVASIWADPNLPLSYQFAFVSPSTGAAMVVQSRAEASLVSTTLPAGGADHQHSLTCVVQVFDSLSAMSTASAAVAVLPVISAAVLQSSMRAQLSSSAGNQRATKGLLSVGGAALNTVSCALAPSCAPLYREECSNVQNTCGECLSGYVGESGSNSPCIKAAQAKTPTTGAGSVGAPCSSDGDCSGWNRCDTTLSAPVCYLPSKRCLNECSGHGECRFLRAVDSSVLADCKISDPSCSAHCECGAAYSGGDCSSPAAVVLERQALRSEFLLSLLSVAETDDANEENIAALSTSLASLTQNPFELAQDSQEVVTAVADIVLSRMATVPTATYGSVVSVLDALDSAALAAARSGDRDPLGAAVTDTVSRFADTVATQLVAGQEEVSFIQDTFRMMATRQRATDFADRPLAAPVTNLEAAASSLASTVVLNGLGNDANDEVAVSLVSTAASAFGVLGQSFNTNPLRVKVSRSSASDDTVLRFTLYHHAAVQFTNSSEAAALGFNSTCQGQGDCSVYYHSCPGSGEELVHNCTGLAAGRLTSFCPVLRPSCAVLNATASTMDTNSSMCEVTGYDAYSTNCTCTLRTDQSGPPGGRRLSSALAQSGLLDIVSSSVYLASEYVDTFSSADDFNSLEDLQQVLIVVIMFATLWAGGIFLTFGLVWRHRWMQPFNAEKESKMVAKAERVQSNTKSVVEVRRYLTDYVVATFPSVFSNKPFFSRVFLEITRHHKYLRVLTAEPGEAGDKQRVLVGMQLLCVQTMLMFSLALLYDVQGPADDGSCVRFTDSDSCLQKRSPFDDNISFCQWRAANSGGSCLYREPVFTIQVVIYIAVIIALLTAVFNYPIDALFELLSAPVADDVKLASQEDAISRIGRRMSNVARRVSNAAIGIASAAQAKLATTRRSIVGTVTRKIPPATESAHALARASVASVADDFRRSLQARQMSRLREFHDFNDLVARPDGSDADSDSEGEESGAVQVRQVTHVAARDGDRKSVGDTGAIMRRLTAEIAYQRQKLKPSELAAFDDQWGLDPATGEFLHGDASSLSACMRARQGVEALIQKEVRFVRAETTKRVEKLNIATDKHTGLEILHMFIKDLLGRNTPAAIIFETKTTEDFEHTKVVSRATKYAAVAALVVLNAFFVYYALLTGFRRGVSWQRMYLLACILQIVVEITLFETMEVAWVHCAVPALVSEEVRAVGDSIIDVVQQLCAGTVVDTARFLNAPDYLFVSTNVAKKFPNLMESVLVQAYTSHLPGELAKTWHGGSAARGMPRTRRALRDVAVLGTVLATVQYLATAPFLVHRMFIRFVQPFVLTAFALLWAFVVSDPTYLAVACALSACALAYLLYRYYLDKVQTATRVQGVARVEAEYAQEDDNKEAALNTGGGALHEVRSSDSVSPFSGRMRASSMEESGDASCSSASQRPRVRTFSNSKQPRRKNPVYDTSSDDAGRGSNSDSDSDSDIDHCKSSQTSDMCVQPPHKGHSSSKAGSQSVSSLQLDSVSGSGAPQGPAVRRPVHLAGTSSASDSDRYSVSTNSSSSDDEE